MAGAPRTLLLRKRRLQAMRPRTAAPWSASSGREGPPRCCPLRVSLECLWSNWRVWGSLVKGSNSGKPTWTFGCSFCSHQLLTDYRHVSWLITRKFLLSGFKPVVLVELKEFHGHWSKMFMYCSVPMNGFFLFLFLAAQCYSEMWLTLVTLWVGSYP